MELTDFVLNRLLDIVPNLSLVIYGIKNKRKQMPEYYEHFDSFQLTIELEKGYLACSSLI